jgi:hypothetical protein
MRQSVFCVASALLMAIGSFATDAAAQPQPFDGKLLIGVNVGIQVGDNDISRQSTFDLYDEQAVVDVNQTINNGAFFEVGGAMKWRGRLGFGVAYSFLSNKGEGTISGQLPHPQFFDQPRSFNASADDLAHTEQAVHIQAVWFIPFTTKVDFAVSAGPSIFNVKQELLRSVTFSEIPPAFTSVTIDSVDVVELRDSGWGFNLGLDMTYALTPRIGVGGLVRYTYGNVEFNLSESQTADVTAGGFQIGGGVRLKF